MKYKGILALLAVAPLTLLCACGGTVSNLSFNANWYKNTSLKDNLAGTNEELEYELSFHDLGSDTLSLSYTEGIYKTKLVNGQIQLDNETREGYIYTTDLTVKVQFTVKGEKSAVFEDKIHSEAQFLSAARGLRPVKSLKTIYCHAPISATPSSLNSGYGEYDISYEIDYDDALTQAEVVYTDKLHSQNSETKNYTLKGDGSFLDNEELLFALRGLDLTVPTSFRSLNLVQGKASQVSLTTLEQTTASVDFTADGEEIKREDLPVSGVTLRYAGSGGGEPQTLIYAKTTDTSSNQYRNVLVEMQVPVYYSLGTLTYKLRTATFTSK